MFRSTTLIWIACITALSLVLGGCGGGSGGGGGGGGSVPSGKPVILSTPGTSVAVAGTYTYEVVVTDPNDDPLTITLSAGSPAGMTLNDNVLSWIPTSAQIGVHAVSITVTDGTWTVSQPWAISVGVSQSPGDLLIDTATLDDGMVGDFYSVNLAASGGSVPYLWDMSGQLPPGVQFTSGGTLNGVPQIAGTYLINIRVEDSSGRRAVRGFAWEILPAASPLGITTTSLPDGTAGSAYSTAMAASGGVAPYSWSATGLPTGLSIDSAGTISGSPAASGTSSVSITVTDDRGVTDTTALSLTVNSAAPLSITTTDLPDGYVNTAYSGPVQATGGTPPYTFDKTSGDFPSGLWLRNATGEIQGTPDKLFEREFTIQVTDSMGATADRTFTIRTFTENGIHIVDRMDYGIPDIDGIPNDGSDDQYDMRGNIIRRADGNYDLWWMRKHPSAGRDTIHHAWGRDAVHWHDHTMVIVSEPTNPGEGIHAAEPTVIKVNGTYYVCYETSSDPSGSGKPQINMATSTDGITWVKFPRMIPGRENDPIEPIMPYPDPSVVASNPQYGIGWPCLMYRNGKFILYYYDGATKKENVDASVNAMRRVESSDPFNWNTDHTSHPIVFKNSPAHFGYHPTLDRVVIGFRMPAGAMIDPKPDNRGEIYVAVSEDSDGLVFNPNRGEWYDNDAYRVTLDEPNERARLAATLQRDEHGWLQDNDGRPFPTITLTYTNGEKAAPGQIVNTTWPTWDLRMKQVQLSTNSNEPMEPPSGLNVNGVLIGERYHIEDGVLHPIINDGVFDRITGNRPDIVYDLPAVRRNALTTGLYWLEGLNIRREGSNGVHWVNNFKRYSYTSWNHFLQYNPEGGSAIEVLPVADYSTAVQGIPVVGPRP